MICCITVFILLFLSCDQKSVTIQSIDFYNNGIKLELSEKSNIRSVEIFESETRVFRQSYSFETKKITLNYNWLEYKDYTFHVFFNGNKTEKSKNSQERQTNPQVQL